MVRILLMINFLGHIYLLAATLISVWNAVQWYKWCVPEPYKVVGNFGLGTVSCNRHM